MDVLFNYEALKDFISGLGFWGPAVFFLLVVLQVIIAPIPGNLLTMAGGALFGVWLSFLLAYTGNVLGSVIGFLIVRKFGRAAAVKLIGAQRSDKYISMIGTESASSRAKILLILIVLLPFLPSDLMCLIAGLTTISFRSFFIIIILCRPWGQLAAALLGKSSFHMPLGALIPLVAFMIAVCVLAVRFAPRLEQFVFRLAHKITDRFSGGKE